MKKIQMRRGVFETNSSSVHSMTMCTSNDYERFKNGELVFNAWDKCLVEITPEIKQSMKKDYGEYYTYDDFWDYEKIDFNKFEQSITTPSGEDVVAFGYYGHD